MWVLLVWVITVHKCILCIINQQHNGSGSGFCLRESSSGLPKKPGTLEWARRRKFQALFQLIIDACVGTSYPVCCERTEGSSNGQFLESKWRVSILEGLNGAGTTKTLNCTVLFPDIFLYHRVPSLSSPICLTLITYSAVIKKTLQNNGQKAWGQLDCLIESPTRLSRDMM